MRTCAVVRTEHTRSNKSFDHSCKPERHFLSAHLELYPNVMILEFANGTVCGKRSRSHITSPVNQVSKAFPLRPCIAQILSGR